MNDTNGGLYMALMGQYGRPRDAGAYSIMSLSPSPFLTMVTLGIAGRPPFRGKRSSARCCPRRRHDFGNLDRNMRDFLAARSLF